MRELTEIVSKDNEQVKSAVKLMSGRKQRLKEGRFLLEGLRLCKDALSSGLHPIQVFITSDCLEKEGCEQIVDCAKQAYLVSPEIARRLSDTETPQGVFCVFPLLDNCNSADKIEGEHVLLLSSLQDPGNVGTIIRTAEALGIGELILSSDCPDIYSPKVLRGSMGAVFRIHTTIVEDLQETIINLRGKGITVYAAALQEDSTPVTKLNFQRPSAVVIGNEGNGLTQGIISCCTATMMIPMKGRGESLNAAAAAAIALWEMTRPIVNA